MNCDQASLLKGGTLTSQFNMFFDQGGRTVISTNSLRTELSGPNTCRAYKGLYGGNYAVHGKRCDNGYKYIGQFWDNHEIAEPGFFGNCRFVGAQPQWEWVVIMFMESWGGELKYFETRLNAYGRQAKVAYELPANEPRLHDPSPSNSELILNYYDPDTGNRGSVSSDLAFVRYTSFSYAVGNDVEYNLDGYIQIHEYYDNGAEDPYWGYSQYNYTGTSKRTFSDIEIYGG